MRVLITLIGVFFFFESNAQNEKTVAYINQYKEIAMQEMSRSGVPASITLAQAVLESQSGESVLVKKSNNHFGIKCKVEWTGAKVYHNDDAKGECFRAYSSAEKSFQDHSNFLKTRPHYAFLFNLNPMDYEAWAYGLKKAGYATAPTYPQKLIKVITDYNLNQYNIIAIAKAKEQTPATPDKTNIEAVSKPINNNTTAQPGAGESREEREEIPSKTTTTNKNMVAPNSNPSPYPSGIFLNNELKVIYASKGTSMLALANEYHITLSKLLSFNDMDEIDILPTNQLIYLERKQKKGITDFYISKSGESIYQIAQITGVRIENILQYNIKFRKSKSVAAGSKIWLITPTESSSTTNKK